MTAVAPPSNRNKIFSIVVVFALIALGIGVVYSQGAPGSAQSTADASPQTVVPTEYGSISNTNISVTQLFSDIGGLYFGSAVDQALHIQLFTGTLAERLTNVTLDLTGSPLGVPLLMVSQGTLTAQIVPAGLSLTFQGDATSPDSTYVLTSFSFIYSSHTTTTTRGTTSQASGNLNAAFVSLVLPTLVNAVQNALASSPDPATQVQNLASYLSSVDYALGSIPGFTGQGYQQAAAFILYSATLGTSLANSAYLQLSQAMTTTSTTTSSSA